MKNCIGKDLSKIPIPVNFSEPISMLQRITEELEYSSALDAAAKINNNWEQLAYVAAFTISSYSTTAKRVNKPFNPLLGETYEWDRTDDLGWRSIAGEDTFEDFFFSFSFPLLLPGRGCKRVRQTLPSISIFDRNNDIGSCKT